MVTPHFFGIFVATRAVLTALLTLLLGNTYHARNIVASVLVMVWAARMAGTFLTTPVGCSRAWQKTTSLPVLRFVGFLLFRVLKIGSDSRFNTIRAHFFKFLGKLRAVSRIWELDISILTKRRKKKLIGEIYVSTLVTGFWIGMYVAMVHVQSSYRPCRINDWVRAPQRKFYGYILSHT